MKSHAGQLELGRQLLEASSILVHSSDIGTSLGTFETDGERKPRNRTGMVVSEAARNATDHQADGKDERGDIEVREPKSRHERWHPETEEKQYAEEAAQHPAERADVLPEPQKDYRVAEKFARKVEENGKEMSPKKTVRDDPPRHALAKLRVQPLSLEAALADDQSRPDRQRDDDAECVNGNGSETKRRLLEVRQVGERHVRGACPRDFRRSVRASRMIDHAECRNSDATMAATAKSGHGLRVQATRSAATMTAAFPMASLREKSQTARTFASPVR